MPQSWIKIIYISHDNWVWKEYLIFERLIFLESSWKLYCIRRIMFTAEEIYFVFLSWCDKFLQRITYYRERQHRESEWTTKDLLLQFSQQNVCNLEQPFPITNYRIIVIARILSLVLFLYCTKDCKNCCLSIKIFKLLNFFQIICDCNILINFGLIY